MVLCYGYLAMPTKPSVTPEIFASEATYSVAVLPTTPTDASALAGTATKLALPGTSDFYRYGNVPAGPAPGQLYNSFFNILSQYALWASEGSSDPDQDAHIVETNAGGAAALWQLRLQDGFINDGAALTVAATIADPLSKFQNLGTGEAIQVIGGTTGSGINVSCGPVTPGLSPDDTGVASTAGSDGGSCYQAFAIGLNSFGFRSTATAAGSVAGSFSASGDADGVEIAVAGTGTPLQVTGGNTTAVEVVSAAEGVSVLANTTSTAIGSVSGANIGLKLATPTGVATEPQILRLNDSVGIRNNGESTARNILTSTGPQHLTHTTSSGAVNLTSPGDGFNAIMAPIFVRPDAGRVILKVTGRVSKTAGPGQITSLSLRYSPAFAAAVNQVLNVAIDTDGSFVDVVEIAGGSGNITIEMAAFNTSAVGVLGQMTFAVVEAIELP